MHNLRYVRNDGKSITLNYGSGYVVAHLKGLNGYDVSLRESQGYDQIGSTVDAMSVAGQPIYIDGFILDRNTLAKAKLLDVFTPLTYGKLYLDSRYWIDVFVSSSPTISSNKHSVFSLSLLAPSPYWSGANVHRYQLGGVTPMFSFPVNYSTAHTFGVRSADTFFNCRNGGNVPADFRLEILGSENILNPSVTNVYTQKSISFVGTLTVGQKLSLYREGDLLRVTITEDDVETDAFDMLDDTSTLFVMNVGDNLLRASASAGESTMITVVTFYDAHAGVLADAV